MRGGSGVLPALPVEAALPGLIAALDAAPNAVLIAPPGAGKTTAVAPAMLGRPWRDGKIIVLAPRRLAARAAAERMAELAGEAVGRTIGRSEARRVGKEGVSTCRSWWSSYP